MRKKQRLRLGRGLLAAAILSVTASPALTQVIDWTGQASSDWFNPDNWNPSSVPTATDAVQIDTTTPSPTAVNGTSADVGVINVGFDNAADLSIVNGGTLTSHSDQVNDVIGFLPGVEATVLVSGVGSAWVGDSLLVNRGTLTIEAGGAVHSTAADIANATGSEGVASVAGTGSTWNIDGPFVVGRTGLGHLTIEEGGTVTVSAPATNLGVNPESQGAVLVTGEDSVLTGTGGINLGFAGIGTLTTANEGVVDTVGGPIVVAALGSATGTLNIGAPASESPDLPGTLDTPSIQFGDGSGTLSFNHTAVDYEFAPTLLGPGVVNVLAGTTRLTADADTFGGTTHVVGGTLRVEAELAGTLDVQPSGRLEGGAPSTVGPTTNAGTVATRGATLNVAGDYTQTTTGTLEVEIAPGVGIVQLNAAGGAVDLQGGVLSVLMAPGDYPPGSSFPIITASEGITGGFDSLVQSDPSVPFEIVTSGNVLEIVVPFETEVFSPLALAVDPEPVISDGNQVFEPGERVDVAPTWENGDSIARELTGTATNFTGPAGPTYTLVLDEADYDLVPSGEAASCLVTGLCYQMDIGPPGIPRPSVHWDATFDETLSDETVKAWTLHLGDSFTDVPRDHPHYRFIETLLHRGATTGCSAGIFCPHDPATRAEAAVFLLRGLEGAGFTPPPCVDGEERFDDVPAADRFCPWIEELGVRGITSGCGGGNFCPEDAVTRAQAAPLLLRTLEGSDYTPPPCTGVFADVPCPSPFANWIEDLFARGITAGCGGGNYCPALTTTRSQMAVLVTRTFGLALYGP